MIIFNCVIFVDMEFKWSRQNNRHFPRNNANRFAIFNEVIIKYSNYLTFSFWWISVDGHRTHNNNHVHFVCTHIHPMVLPINSNEIYHLMTISTIGYLEPPCIFVNGIFPNFYPAINFYSASSMNLFCRLINCSYFIS